MTRLVIQSSVLDLSRLVTEWTSEDRLNISGRVHGICLDVYTFRYVFLVQHLSQLHHGSQIRYLALIYAT